MFCHEAFTLQRQLLTARKVSLWQKASLKKRKKTIAKPRLSWFWHVYQVQAGVICRGVKQKVHVFRWVCPDAPKGSRGFFCVSVLQKDCGLLMEILAKQGTRGHLQSLTISIDSSAAVPSPEGKPASPSLLAMPIEYAQVFFNFEVL